MSDSNRYTVTGDEGVFEPGSNEQVLKNLLGIVDPNEMNVVETELLDALYMHIFENIPENITFSTISHWHKMWLGNVYRWAGEIRTVNMAKPDIDFASPLQIPRLANRLEAELLAHYGHLPELNDDELVLFMSKIHVEFILIHPFREGNGRISRLLLDVIAVKAGLEPLDYSLWDKHKPFYFKAIQAGRDGDLQRI
ncbi:MAG: Fic family protein [Gammaproteobacteria bacterium]|nr:Fic family protein [Gammaproteobacteria bacterium]